MPTLRRIAFSPSIRRRWRRRYAVRCKGQGQGVRKLMRCRPPGTLLLCLGLAGWLAGGPVSPLSAQIASDSQLFELNFSKGLLKFNQGLYTDAERYLADALKAKPDDSEARFYYGQTLLRTQRPSEGEQVFRELLKREPGSGRALLGLGMAQFQQGAYREAVASLTAAQQALPEDPLVHFYQGLAHVKLGQFELAQPRLFTALTLSPDLAPDVHFQSGLAYYQQGLLEEAKQEFQAVVQAEPQAALKSDAHFQRGLEHYRQGRFAEAKQEFEAVPPGESQSDLARSALGYLQQLAQPRPAATGQKRWDLGFTITEQYDSNVVLLPGGVQPPGGSTGISQKEDFRTALYGRGELRPFDNGTWTLGAAYSLYQSFHRRLSGFDVQDHTPSIYVQHKAGSVTSRLAYAYDYINVGRSPYLIAHAIQPTITITESERLFTQVQLRYQNKDFQHGLFLFNSTRDGKNWLAGVTQFILFADKQAHLRVGYTFDKDVTGGGSPAVATPGDTTNADWAYDGHRVTAGIGLPPVWKIRGDLGFDYYRQDYRNPNSFSTTGTTVRRDNVYLLNASLSREIGAGLSIIGQYSYTRDQVNVGAFDYNRNVFSLTLAGQY